MTAKVKSERSFWIDTRKPKMGKEGLSPASRICAIVRATPFAGDLTAQGQAALTSSLDDFQIRYSPVKKAKKTREIFDVFTSKINPKGTKIEFHYKATEQLKDCTWAREILRRIKTDALPFPIYNLEHILRGEGRANKVVGLHVCPPGSRARALVKNLQINPENGVMCGRAVIVTSKGTGCKSSTFFPDAFQTIPALMGVIGSGQLLLREESYSLFLARTQPPFYFETIMNRGDLRYLGRVLTYQGGGVLTTSAYPVLGYYKLRLGETLQITSSVCVLTDDLVRAYENDSAKERQKYRKYGFLGQDQNGLQLREVYDVARYIPGLGVERGVYVEVPTGFVQSMPAAGVPTGAAYSPSFTSMTGAYEPSSSTWNDLSFHSPDYPTGGASYSPCPTGFVQTGPTFYSAPAQAEDADFSEMMRRTAEFYNQRLDGPSGLSIEVEE
jgi:hypothetical protein